MSFYLPLMKGARGMFTLHSFKHYGFHSQWNIPLPPSQGGFFLLVILSEVKASALPLLRGGVSAFVILNASEESRKHPLIKLRYALEILPPFGRLNDNYWG